MSAFEVGDAVIYQPHHQANPERGIITKISNSREIIFVRYNGDLHAKATRASDLRREL